jgi:hypothetical protein
MKDPSMRKMFPQHPFFARFWRGSISDVSHFDGLAFGTRIASWYGEERTFARARPREV